MEQSWLDFDHIYHSYIKAKWLNRQDTNQAELNWTELGRNQLSALPIVEHTLSPHFEWSK